MRLEGDEIQRPLYRTTRVTAINGLPYDAGMEVYVDGWPKLPDLEPANEPARRVVACFNRYRSHPNKPQTPHNALLNRIYLPGHLPDFGPEPVFNPHFDQRKDSTVSPVPESEAVDTMPRYKSSQDDLYLGKTLVKTGTQFCFLAWPLDCFMPVNAAANAVRKYYEANSGNPSLLPSPWCSYRADIVLPSLPPIKDEIAEAARARDATLKALRASGYDVQAVR